MTFAQLHERWVRTTILGMGIAEAWQARAVGAARHVVARAGGLALPTGSAPAGAHIATFLRTFVAGAERERAKERARKTYRTEWTVVAVVAPSLARACLSVGLTLVRLTLTTRRDEVASRGVRCRTGAGGAAFAELGRRLVEASAEQQRDDEPAGSQHRAIMARSDRRGRALSQPSWNSVNARRTAAGSSICG
jgi:hypothetical protein